LVTGDEGDVETLAAERASDFQTEAGTSSDDGDERHVNPFVNRRTGGADR
jgi:hypothetical protein